MSDEWRDRAACKGMDSDWFFPERGASMAAQKALCATCPVRENCLEFGLGERFGIWGGTSEKERRGIRRERGVTVNSITVDSFLRDDLGHGSEAAYRAHYRSGGKVCETCRQGHNRRSLERKHSRRRGASAAS